MSDTDLDEALAGLLTLAEAAALAGTSTETVRRWRKAGLIRAVKLQHAMRIVRSSLTEYLDRRAAQQSRRLALA